MNEDFDTLANSITFAARQDIHEQNGSEGADLNLSFGLLKLRLFIKYCLVEQDT